MDDEEKQKYKQILLNTKINSFTKEELRTYPYDIKEIEALQKKSNIMTYIIIVYKEIHGIDYKEPEYTKFSKRKEKIKGKVVNFNDKKTYHECT